MLSKKKIHKKIKIPIKQIINEEPHYRYQVDIWYLDKELKKILNMNNA